MDGSSWMDYVLYMMPIETGAGIGVRPYDLFTIQIAELSHFVEEDLEDDENEHFLFFMLAARRLVQDPTTRKVFSERLVTIYRENIERVLQQRMRLWEEVFIPRLGCDADYVHAIPDMRRERYQLILDLLEIPARL